MTRYARPKTLDEALSLLGEGHWRVVAGATDFYPSLGNRPLTEDILDINGLTGLRGIARTGGHFVIGARTSWTEIQHADLPPAFDALKQAAREVGAIQIQNVASIAGNICNASPAADGVPPLLALDAEVELSARSGVRVLPLREFVLGNRKTALRRDELLTAILIPERAARGNSAFIKLGARRYLVISIAMAATRIVVDADGRMAEASVAVGSCSAVARRLAGLEQALTGQHTAAIAALVAASALDELSPIDDVRGTAAYRLQAVREIVVRALQTAAGDPQRRAAA
ncbi:FAD binding domain-containing protein [Aminobacter sp. HY435]|uniref:FAD binding domain-containing protein n=1 Tax=Aminobacter sp. HY435 TaxID=2970917 RepID=UPI0022B98702|nr:xanthine dehydrogenase family protein subunit M [Aminobacter sp. HY435]